MLTLGLIVIVAFLARLEWARRRYRRQRDLMHAWLLERGVGVERLRVGFAHGWPFYEVVFRSGEESTRFGASPLYPELLRYVEQLNASHRRFGRDFDPRLAVLLMPPLDTTARPGGA